MRGKIKFFSTRPFELHRPRDHALLLLVLYTVYTFRGMRSTSLSLVITLLERFVAHFRRNQPRDHFKSFPEKTLVLYNLCYFNIFTILKSVLQS